MKNIIASTIKPRTRKSRVTKLTKSGFFENIDAIRKRARDRVEKGAVTDSYKADRNALVSLLNDALATELVCVLRYMRHFYMATGINAKPAAAEFLEHANEEWNHVDALAKRIVQLGGEPDFSPAQLAARSHAEYVAATSLEEMMRENLVAERIAIETYGQIIRHIGDDDPTTRRMLEEILADEEEHADDLASMLDSDKS